MPGTRQQFNVNLDPELVRRVKHHAIDVQLTLSDLVTRVLRDHLEHNNAPRESAMSDQSPTRTAMTLQPMVHVADMAAAVGFYEALGAQVEHGSRDGDFVMLRLGASRFSLLAHPPNPEQNEGRVELNFETAEELDGLEARLRAANVTITQPTTDEGFGRQLQVSTPDGLLVKINQLDQELYT
ncbi:VOC family protein [Plantactinospora siamensis]|uniref:VOC family protein n=1 Tax=Plantactinospora siamensis TaxID=555372 RepID=A0ABV6NTM0_9ACTN